MPKHISQEDLESIVEVMADFPDGIGIEKIYLMLEGKIARRTLQRRLALLVEQKRLIKEGKARAIGIKAQVDSMISLVCRIGNRRQ